MNTEILKTFLCLAEIKNYTKTASHLFVAQSTVTNRILELEKELGYCLFIRNRKKLQLTVEGECFLEYAKRILDLEKSARFKLAALTSFSQSIRIGTTSTIYDCHLGNYLLKFQEKYPDISINVLINHSLPLIQMLQDNIIDLAFTYMPYLKNNIACSQFATDPLLLVTSKENILYENGITQNELSHIPYYYCDFTFQDLGSYIKSLFPKNHFFPLTIDRSNNLIPFLINGKGYSFLPESMIKPFLSAGSLITIKLLDFSIPPISCYILYKKNQENELKFIRKDFFML